MGCETVAISDPPLKTLYEVGVFAPDEAVHERSILPSLNALLDGTFVAVKFVGAFGPVKLSCAAALLPIFFMCYPLFPMTLNLQLTTMLLLQP